jgi:hypothetical protein
MPTHKSRFAPGRLQFSTSAFPRAKLFESDRLT